MIRTIPLLLLIFVTLSATAQDRASIEASRLAVLQQLEQTEKALNRIKNAKQELLKEISQLESSDISTRDEIEIDGVDDNTQRLQALNQEAITENESTIQEVAEEFLEETKSDFSEIMILQEQLLQNKVRAEQLNAEGYKETNKLVDAMINERHLVQLTAHINQRQTEGIDLSEKTTDEQPQEEPEEPKKETTIAPINVNESPTPSTNQRSVKELFQEISRLTDEESKIRLKKKNLEADQAQLNLQYDAVLRQPSNFGSSIFVESTPTANTGYDSTILKKKGFLPWPVADATLTKRFGPQNDSGSITSTSISMRSNNKQVTSIYQGRVDNIETINGKKILTISHNGIISNYVGLSTILVRQGESIFQNQQIGTFSNELQFQLLENNSPQNPLHWLQNN